MSLVAPALGSFLDGAADAALVEVVAAKGSTPREKGAWMLVSRNAIFGTIGGGQLEYMAIDKARQLLSGGPAGRGTLARRTFGRDAAAKDIQERSLTLSIPLGPEIGQCCGGWVEVSVRGMDDAMRSALLSSATAEDRVRPHVYVFGGGHVGHALAAALSLLPVHAIVVETRADELKGLPGGVEARLMPLPEDAVRDAPPGAAFLILTHDHALDFLIAAEVLKRADVAYVGMIGSKSKKATFRSWYLKTAGGNTKAFGRLVSPIGGEAVKDKRPAIIAALAAAEVMTALTVHAVPSPRLSEAGTAR